MYQCFAKYRIKQDTIRFLNSSVHAVKEYTFYMSIEIKDRKVLHTAMKSKFSPVPAGTNEAESLQSFLQWMHLRLRAVVEGACFQPFEDGFTISALTRRQYFDLIPCWKSCPWIYDLYEKGIDLELSNTWTLTRSDGDVLLLRHDAVNGSVRPSNCSPRELQPALEFSSKTDQDGKEVAAADGLDPQA